MKLTSPSFQHEQPIPQKYAFCVPDPESRVAPGPNLNPALSWGDAPEGTKSFALICHNSHAPSNPRNANKAGKSLSPRSARADFYHWVLIGLRADTVGIQEGEFSEGVARGGKEGPAGPRGTRQGINDYTKWFAGDPEMEGTYYGYDGPCPPWNDNVVHHYHFTLYALDVERLPLGERFMGPDVLKAIDGHVLDEARITGTYSTNPDAPA